MTNINYMQALPGGHCFTCHMDFEEKGAEHGCFSNLKPTPCPPGCSKKYGVQDTSLEGLLKEFDTKYVLHHITADPILRYTDANKIKPFITRSYDTGRQEALREVEGMVKSMIKDYPEIDASGRDIKYKYRDEIIVNNSLSDLTSRLSKLK